MCCNTLIALLLLCSLDGVSSYKVESRYKALCLFGPLADDGNWQCRPMQHIGDYHFFKANITVKEGDGFMFVSPLPPDSPVPPNGALNFKQGKLGVGQGNRLQPGGNHRHCIAIIFPRSISDTFPIINRLSSLLHAQYNIARSSPLTKPRRRPRIVSPLCNV